MVEGILQRVEPGGSKWASPIVVRKPNGDCDDYKVGSNHKTCSFISYSKCRKTLHSFAGIKYFAKIDFKKCIQPNPNRPRIQSLRQTRP